MYHWWYTDWYNGTAYSRRFGGPADDRRSGQRPPESGDRPVLTRDQRLMRAVADALFSDPAVTGGRIDLSVQNGVVILDGTVDSESARRAVVAVAWSTGGVSDVCDALTVAARRGDG